MKKDNFWKLVKTHSCSAYNDSDMYEIRTGNNEKIASDHDDKLLYKICEAHNNCFFCEAHNNYFF